MNEELNKTIKEFYIKQQKLVDEMTNYDKTQLISIIEREMNENHYLRNEIGQLRTELNRTEQLRTELNTKDNIINQADNKNLELIQKINKIYDVIENRNITGIEARLLIQDILDKEE